jgi:hypothetical protein
VCVFVLHCIYKHYPSYFLALVVCVMVICIFTLHCVHKHYTSYFDTHYTSYFDTHHTSYFYYVCFGGLFSIFVSCYMHFTFDFWWFGFLEVKSLVQCFGGMLSIFYCLLSSEFSNGLFKFIMVHYPFNINYNSTCVCVCFIYNVFVSLFINMGFNFHCS